MVGQRPEQSLLARAWSVTLSLLGLVIVLSVVWHLLQPLLPVLAVIGGLVLVVNVWQRWRWR